MVEDFSCLGALVECEGGCEKEIRRRITLGKVVMQGLEKIWKDKYLSLQTKTRIVNAMTFPVILYGCETWTKTRAMEKKIDASEMWIWRRTLRVSWTKMRTNQSILMEIGHTRGDLSLRQRAAKQKMMFFCHVIRANGMETNMMLACREGRRKTGRPVKRRMEEMMSGINLAELRGTVEDQDLCESIL